MDETDALRMDPDLLAAFRAGRREALERVYRAHVRAIDRYVRALARSRGVVELAQASVIADLLQEVFIRAFADEARRSYDGVRDYGAYLRAIARNRFTDLLRARGREVLTDPDQLPLDIEAASSADDWCDPRIATIMVAFLAGLAGSLAAVYQQRFVLCSSQEEACMALGMSRRALRTAEERLRRGLRRALSRAGISLAEIPPAQPPARAVLDILPLAASGRARP